MRWLLRLRRFLRPWLLSHKLSVQLQKIEHQLDGLRKHKKYDDDDDEEDDDDDDVLPGTIREGR